MVRVREAESTDAAAVCRVHEASIRGLGPGSYDDEQVDAWAGDRSPADYDHLGCDDDRYDAVGERGAAVVGFGTLTLSSPDYLGEPPAGGDDFATARPVGAVEAVYVHPAHVGDGVGTTLLATIEREAVDHGRRVLGLHASLNAVGFYERHGYDRHREVTHEFGNGDCDVTGTVVEMWKRVRDESHP